MEGYFRVIRKVREIMPSDCISSHFRKKFKLPLKVKDAGVDGLFLGENGQWTAYQAKYRGNQKTVTWGELGTFFGAAESVPQRCVVTNCQEVTERASNRRDYYTIRRADFERLTAEEFSAIETWLKGAKPKLVKEPAERPYQEAAVKDVCNNLKKNSRTHAVMACGTGKTIVALKIAQRMKAKRVLVLLPSLALVRQTYREWLKHYLRPDIRFITVCSDFGINKGIDELTFKACDSEFPVTTDAKELRDRLKGVDKVVVFSTYQSSKVVGKACGRKFQFDLGIFDEAHKTAGKLDSLFAFPLSDKNIRINKRFFLTATPRLVNIRKRDKEGEFEIASMDDPEMYGTLAHRLPFSEAAKKRIICDYKIVASIVTQEDVTRELLKQGEVKGKTDHVRAMQVAHQVALKNAIQKFKLTKLFTFHSSIKGAKSFVAEGDEGIGAHVKKLHTCHVNGSQSSAIRETILSEFREASRALVSNARCLTEGVDVPAVDCVAFIQPRRSRVDIVQAVGRAMRKAKGKACGYLFVPLYVEQKRGESIEEAVERTRFDEVADVLNAMRDHDDDLKDILEVLGVQMGEGKIKGITARAFAEKVSVIGPSIPLARLRKSIQTELVEQLVVSWDVRFGELKAFERKNGHCLVLVRIGGRLGEPNALGLWVSKQRQLRNKGSLSEERIKKLDHLRFDWDPDESAWNEKYKELKTFKENKGHLGVSRDSDLQQLAVWQTTQRVNFIKGLLRKDRGKKLNRLGIDWNPIESQWNERFEELMAFQKKEGHCRVSKNTRNISQSFGRWVDKQRGERKRGNLHKDKIERLDDLGFVWDLHEAFWNEMYEVLKVYHKNEGHCVVPTNCSENPSLGSWIASQRNLFSKGNLSIERIKKLDKLGFDWDPLESRWNENIERLTAYCEEYGNCLVPRNYTKDPTLAQWVMGLRSRRFKRKNVSEQKIKQLDELGFDWNPIETIWYEKYKELRAFKKREGHCRVLVKDNPENPQLGTWVGTQRSLRKAGKLSNDRIRMLDQLSFTWHPDEDFWDEQFKELKSFQKVEGHCLVPRRYSKQLSQWVFRQRDYRKAGTISELQVKRLDSIGFVWDVLERQWDEMYALLKAFYQREGHCRVPDKSHGKLGAWVQSHRTRRNKGNLAKEIIEKLDELNFDWNPIESYWREMYDGLVAFHNLNNHCNVPSGYSKNPKLKQWIGVQRRSQKKGKLSVEKIKNLEKLGFAWERDTTIDDYFWARFRDLKAYFMKEGHCNVTRVEDEQLASFVFSIRQRIRSDRTQYLKKDQISALEEFGFEWDPNQSRWEKMCKSLLEYRDKHGNCRVPAQYPENQKLANWVVNQRQFNKKNDLDEEKKRKLNQIGFWWGKKA